MKLGLLSDTHGNLPRTRSALALLREHGAQTLIHCGDIGSEAVLNLLFEVSESGIPVHAVAGNVDEWETDFMLYAKKLGFPLPRVLRFDLDNLRIALHHGHYYRHMDELSSAPDLDILFTGHTHVPSDDCSGSVRVINPGAVHRANPPGVSLFDTTSGHLTFLTL